MGPLIRKELRAGWMFALLAFLAQSWVVVSLLVDFDVKLLRDFDLFGPVLARSPFARVDYAEYPGTIAMFLGLALGLLQTVPESVQGTTPYLVHIAGGRPSVVSAKLLSGAVLFLAAALPVLFGFPVAAARDGLGVGDLAHLWVVLAACFVLYLGTLACLIRGHRGLVQGLVQQLAIATFVIVGLAVSLGSPVLGPALVALGLVGSFTLAAAYAGFSVRQF